MGLKDINFETKDYVLLSVTIVGLILLYFTLKGSVNSVDTKLDGLNKSLKDVENKSLSLNSQYKSGMSGNVNVTGMVCFKYNNTNYCLSGKDILRLNSMYPNDGPYINVVNRRPLFGIGGINAVTINTTNPTNIGPYVYGPFRFYNTPPPAKNAKRKWRIYASYTDNIGPGEIVVRLVTQKNWVDRSTFNMDFKLPVTCGGHAGQTRDGNSDILEVPSQYPEPVHAELQAFINPSISYVRCGSNDSSNWCGCYDANRPNGYKETTAFTIYYLELQALDVYE